MEKPCTGMHVEPASFLLAQGGVGVGGIRGWAGGVGTRSQLTIFHLAEVAQSVGGLATPYRWDW